MRLVALVLTMALLSLGCSKTNLAEIVKAAAGDPASFCISGNLMTPWGSEKGSVARTNITNGTVTCNDTGMSVNTAPTVNVPVGVQAVPR